MCLIKLLQPNEVLSKCKKSPSRHFIGYKVVVDSDTYGLCSPFQYSGISTLNKLRAFRDPMFINVDIWSAKRFSYPNGFHIYAFKKDAVQVMRDLRKNRKGDGSYAGEKLRVIPVYFYKKDIMAEGLEDFHGGGALENVIVVKSYRVKREDIENRNKK